MNSKKEIKLFHLQHYLKQENRNKFNDIRKKDLYSENYKILMKESEEDTNKWRGSLCF